MSSQSWKSRSQSRAELDPKAARGDPPATLTLTLELESPHRVDAQRVAASRWHSRL